MLFKCISEIDLQGMTNDGIIECLYGNGFCFFRLYRFFTPEEPRDTQLTVVRCVYVIVFVC